MFNERSDNGQETGLLLCVSGKVFEITIPGLDSEFVNLSEVREAMFRPDLEQVPVPDAEHIGSYLIEAVVWELESEKTITKEVVDFSRCPLCFAPTAGKIHQPVNAQRNPVACIGRSTPDIPKTRFEFDHVRQSEVLDVYTVMDNLIAAFLNRHRRLEPLLAQRTRCPRRQRTSPRRARCASV